MNLRVSSTGILIKGWSLVYSKECLSLLSDSFGIRIRPTKSSVNASVLFVIAEIPC